MRSAEIHTHFSAPRSHPAGHHPRKLGKPWSLGAMARRVGSPGPIIGLAHLATWMVPSGTSAPFGNVRPCDLESAPLAHRYRGPISPGRSMRRHPDPRCIWGHIRQSGRGCVFGLSLDHPLIHPTQHASSLQRPKAESIISGQDQPPERGDHPLPAFPGTSCRRLTLRPSCAFYSDFLYYPRAWPRFGTVDLDVTE